MPGAPLGCGDKTFLEQLSYATVSESISALLPVERLISVTFIIFVMYHYLAEMTFLLSMAL